MILSTREYNSGHTCAIFCRGHQAAMAKNDGRESQASNGATRPGVGLFRGVPERTHRSPRSGAARPTGDLGAIGVLPEMSHFTAEFLQMLRWTCRRRFNIR
jgi:hypothetical protein